MAVAKDIKITYATLAAQSEELHRAFDQAIESVKSQLGQQHPIYIGGEPRIGRETLRDINPADTRQALGHFQRATAQDVRDAVAAAKRAFAIWGSTSWQERVRIMRRAADLFREKRFELSALVAMEAGKSRLEALGDVEESADLISYYAKTLEENNGFERPLSTSGKEKTWSILKPWGVWAVIAPFNFPFALATGMSAGALLGGNTVVFKPASDTPYCGLKIYEIFAQAGLPPGAFNYITGSGEALGNELVTNPEIDGLVFTGSKDVGTWVFRKFTESLPRPCITEMGGKNPAIVTANANLEKAVEGVARSAFGYQGQKCSACSRVYVDRRVKKRFVEALVERTKGIKVGDPLERDTFMGPVINQRAYENYQQYVQAARQDGGRVLIGGEALKGGIYEHGYFVAPTIIDGLPKEHRLFREELFVPILVVAEVDSLDEALEWANRSEYGLTAGIFSEDQEEIKKFFDQMQAGVLYANRRGGATTGAWPGVQSFCGWKASGSSGKGALGPYYVAQFMREQSQTIVED